MGSGTKCSERRSIEKIKQMVHIEIIASYRTMNEKITKLQFVVRANIYFAKNFKTDSLLISRESTRTTNVFIIFKRL